MEISSRTGLGEGLIDMAVYELADCPIVLPLETDALQRIIIEARQRESLSLRDEIAHPNKQELDNLIFDELDLSIGEREAVYEAVINLVEKRLQKAGSLKKG